MRGSGKDSFDDTNYRDGDIFQSLQTESVECLLGLDNNPDRLYEYFAEQSSTKLLFSQNAAVKHSNLELAKDNVSLRERIDKAKEELTISTSKLKDTRAELYNIANLCNEIEGQTSYDSVIRNITSDLMATEKEYGQLVKNQLQIDQPDYSQLSQELERNRRRYHSLAFSKEWIEMEQREHERNK